MASLMPVAKQQYFDSNGVPLSGGKVYTYSAGTTTPLATYTDSGATTPNANPVVLDSRGEASIFFSAASYKIVLKDSADVTIWTQDNLAGDAAASALAALAASGGSALVGFIQSGTGAVATTVQAKLRESVSVKDFGAVGDGVTDDTAAIQAAIDAAQFKNARLLFPYGVYLHSGLTVSAQTGVSMEGARAPAYTNTALNDGVRLIYTGTGYAITYLNTGGNLSIYRCHLKNIGLWFSATGTISGGIYAKNLQESTWEGISINGDGVTQTITYGINLDGVSISKIDDCIVQNCSTAIANQFLSTSQAAGAYTVTKCNIYNCTTVFDFGLVNFMTIENNWIEAFQTVFLFNNSSPRQRTEAFNWSIENNQILQSNTGLSETRFMKVISADNTKPVRLRGRVAKNRCYLNSNGATRPSYAVSFDMASNVSIVDVQVTFEENTFWGVSTAGIFSDSTFPIITESKNETRDDFYGNLLPNIAGTAIRKSASYVLAQNSLTSTCGANTTENLLATVIIPANTIGKNGSIRISSAWTCTNNGNLKTIRARLGGIGGGIVMEGYPTGMAQVIGDCWVSNRNSAASQLGAAQLKYGSGTDGIWIVGTAIDTTIAQNLVFTGTKSIAGDTLAIEGYIVEVMPS